MPAASVETEVIRKAVRAACRAPSIHNIQPWRWVFDAGVMQLFLDPTRVLPSDGGGREAVIGCGAALDHLRAAMASVGLDSDVERFPNPNDPDLLASIRFSAMTHVTDGHRHRAAAIWQRRSDRLPLETPPDWEAFEPLLRSRVGHHNVQLDVLPEQARPRLAQASQFAESLRLYDSEYHAELHRWTAPFETSTGIPYGALVSASEAERVDIGRNFPTPHHPARRPQIDADRSQIVVLSTRTATRAEALEVGEVLSVVLLESTMAGLATCPLTHLTEVRVARDIVESLVGRDVVPQILIRIGQAPRHEESPPQTPRRPLDEVLVVRDG